MSFQLQKELTCGEGGAVLLFDPGLEPSVRAIRDRGTNRQEFEAGLIDHYSWTSQGSAYAPSELTAAVLEAHLVRSAEVLERRRDILLRYVAGLSGWAMETGAGLPAAAARSGAASVAYVIVHGERQRRSLEDHLDRQGIGNAFHFPPLHRSAMGEQMGAPPGACPVADQTHAGLLRLPLYSALTEIEADRVIDAVQSWRSPVAGPARGVAAPSSQRRRRGPSDAR